MEQVDAVDTESMPPEIGGGDQNDAESLPPEVGGADTTADLGTSAADTSVPPTEVDTPPEIDVPGYPSEIYQDNVGTAYHQPEEEEKDTEPLLATEHNVLARRRQIGFPGVAVDCEHSDDENDDIGTSGGTWDDMLMGSYFNVIGFFFKLNALRLDEKQVPKAIGLLLCLYFVMALYVANVLLGAFMVYVGRKYRDFECEENLTNWLLVMGIYICVSALLSFLSIVMTILLKKDWLAIVRNFAGIFAIVWVIIGCVRTYKIGLFILIPMITS